MLKQISDQVRHFHDTNPICDMLGLNLTHPRFVLDHTDLGKRPESLGAQPGTGSAGRAGRGLSDGRGHPAWFRLWRSVTSDLRPQRAGPELFRGEGLSDVGSAGCLIIVLPESLDSGIGDGDPVQDVRQRLAIWTSLPRLRPSRLPAVAI